MLPKDARLNVGENFKWVADGYKKDLGQVKLFWRFSTNKQALVGVAVKSKDFKSAVLRNKAKRICFRVMKNIYPLLRTELNLVMMPKIDITKVRVSDLEKEIKDVKELFSASN